MSDCKEYITCTSLTEQIGYLIIIPIICTFGILFNTLVLLVFCKASFRSQMTPSLLTYLAGLTTVDLVNSLIGFPQGFVRCIEAPSQDIQYLFNFYEKYLWTSIGHVTMTSSIWITLIITTERFLFLLNNGAEVTGQSIRRSPSCAKWILATIILLAVCFNIPLFLYYDNITGSYPVQSSSFAQSTGYEVFTWLRMFLVQLIPIISVTGLNIALIRIIRANNETLRYMVFPAAVFTKRLQSQNKITVMLLSISSVFVFSNLFEPFAHFPIFSSIFGNCSTESAEYEGYRMSITMFQMICFATNFISYCVFHNLFLSQVKLLFGCKPSKVEDKLHGRQSIHVTPQQKVCMNNDL